MKEDLDTLFMPNVMSSDQTIQYIKRSKCSLCRFGDGEYELMRGNSIPFQEHSYELEKRLKDVFFNSTEQCLVCLNFSYFHQFSRHLPSVRDFIRKRGTIYRGIIKENINSDALYGDSGFSAAFTAFEKYDFDAHYKSIREIWDSKAITIVTGKGLLDEFTYNIYDNASQINIVSVPRMHAFSQYDDILEQVLSTSKKQLVIVACGPTATILCRDLHKNGYRALDLGHLGKDYNAHKLNAERTDEYIHDFFKPD